MIDIFISFTLRGDTNLNWIISFGKKLKSTYQAIYGRDELEIWDMSQNGPGVNFPDETTKLLKETMLLILILDPSFDSSPQVFDEIDKYRKSREEAGEPVLIIKVIKKMGAKGQQLRQIVSSNLLASNFSIIRPNNREEEYAEDSPEYNNEIEKIVKEIRKNKVEQRRKINSQKLLARLAELNNVPKIYVAFGDSTLTNSRSKFINELNGTIKRSNNDKIKEMKVIPDDFTPTLHYEDLSELLCEENEYREKCVEAMLNDCIAIILLFESDNISDAEIYLKKIKYQFKYIKSSALNLQKKLQLRFLLNIPDVLYQTDEFNNEFNSPAYSSYNNIRLVKNEMITSFIESFVDDLNNIPELQLAATPSASEDSIDSNIYIIEFNHRAGSEIPEDELKEEENNRANLWAYIADRKFTLIPRLDPDDDLTLVEAIEKHKEWLSISDGIIIYRGIREDEQWCRKQQSETFKAILELKREKLKKDIVRAVFVDPLQKNRSRGFYSWCNYSVITDYPAELDDFLWHMRQH